MQYTAALGSSREEFKLGEITYGKWRYNDNQQYVVSTRNKFGLKSFNPSCVDQEH